MTQSVFGISPAIAATRKARADSITWEKATGRSPSRSAWSGRAIGSAAATIFSRLTPMSLPRHALAERGRNCNPPPMRATIRVYLADRFCLPSGHRPNSPSMHEIGKAFRPQCLFAVALRVLGLIVHFDHEASAPGGDGGERHLRDIVAQPIPCVGSTTTGKQRLCFQDRDRVQIERVSGHRLEGADASFTKQDVGVAFAQDVFGAHEQVVDRRAKASLEQNGQATAAHFLKRAKFCMLRAPICRQSAYLFDDRQIARVHDLSDDRQPSLGPRFGHETKTILPQALETVGRSAGLKRAAAQDARAGFLDRLRDREDLLLALDGTGTGDQDDPLALPILDARRSRPAAAKRRSPVQPACRVSSLGRQIPLPAWRRAVFPRINSSGPITPMTTRDSPAHHLGAEAELLDPSHDVVDLLVGHGGLSDDDHVAKSRSVTSVRRRATLRCRRPAGSSSWRNRDRGSDFDVIEKLFSHELRHSDAAVGGRVTGQIAGMHPDTANDAHEIGHRRAFVMRAGWFWILLVVDVRDHDIVVGIHVIAERLEACSTSFWMILY